MLKTEFFRSEILSILSFFGLIFTIGIFQGCSTPFLATDNEFLLKFPGTERRSDQIEGVLRPWERRKLIEEKGEKGIGASVEEKQFLVYQLIQEYKKSNDPTIRRTSVEALAKIMKTAEIPAAFDLLTEALHDESLGVRLSAVEALGGYASQVKPADRSVRERSAEALYACYRQLPLSVQAGSKKENDERKDLRLAILRNLGRFDDSETVVAALAEGLDGEMLDDGALRLTAMKSLGKVTGKNYGCDYALWRQYLDYRQGKAANPPKEVSALSGLSLQGLNPLK